MTLSNSNRNILISLELEKANKMMKEAKFCGESGMWNLVGNRLYYSAFHAVVALLLNKGVSIRSHKGACRMFSLHYVQTREFSVDDMSLYSRLQTIRERADYQNDYELTPDEGEEYLKLAEGLLNRIMKFLSEAHS